MKPPKPPKPLKPPKSTSAADDKFSPPKSNVHQQSAGKSGGASDLAQSPKAPGSSGGSHFGGAAQDSSIATKMSDLLSSLVGGNAVTQQTDIVNPHNIVAEDPQVGGKTHSGGGKGATNPEYKATDVEYSPTNDLRIDDKGAKDPGKVHTGGGKGATNPEYKGPNDTAPLQETKIEQTYVVSDKPDEFGFLDVDVVLPIPNVSKNKFSFDPKLFSNISLTAEEKDTSDYDVLWAYVNKKRYDFNSDAEFIKHKNIVARNWVKIKNLLAYYKSGPKNVSALGAVAAQGMVDDTAASFYLSAQEHTTGRLGVQAQMPKDAIGRGNSAPNIAISRDDIDVNDTRVVVASDNISVAKVAIDVSRNLTGDNAASKKLRNVTTLGNDRIESDHGESDDKVTNRGAILVGESTYKDLRAADSTLILQGKSTANMVGNNAIQSEHSIILGNIDKDLNRKVTTANRSGISVSAGDSSSAGPSLRLKAVPKDSLRKKIKVSIPKSIASSGGLNLKATVAKRQSNNVKSDARFVITKTADKVPLPIKNASISANDVGNNVISITVNDVNTTMVKILRRKRNFATNTIKGKMVLLTTVKVPMLVGGKSDVIYVDKSVISSGCIYEYRLVSANGSVDSYDFYDLVSKPSSSGGTQTFKQGKLDNHSGITVKEVGNEVIIKIDNIHPAADIVRLARRNIGRKEKVFFATDKVAKVASDGTVNFEDIDLKEYGTYEYSYIVEDKFSNRSTTGNVGTIQYRASLRSDPERKVYNTVVDNVKEKGNAFSLDVKTDIQDSAFADEGIGKILIDRLAGTNNLTSNTAFDADLKTDMVKDALSKKMPAYRVEVTDNETKTTRSSGFIVGDSVDSSKIPGLKDLDTAKRNYSVKISTAVVELGKYLNESDRATDYLLGQSTIPTFTNRAINIFDENIINEVVLDVGVPKSSGNDKATIENIKTNKNILKSVITWDCSRDNMVDYYIIEKGTLQSTNLWKYIGKSILTTINIIPENADMLGVKYKITPILLDNSLGVAAEA